MNIPHQSAWRVMAKFPGTAVLYLAFACGAASADLTGPHATVWQRSYNSPVPLRCDDFTEAMAIDPAGNPAVIARSYKTGASSDYYTTKYAARTGRIIWQQRYNDSTGGEDEPNDVATDSAGNVFVTGVSGDASGKAGYHIIKYAAATGAVLWQQRYSDSASKGSSALAIAVDAAGNAITTGFVGNSQGVSDFLTIKYAAADGAIVWEKRYNGPGNSSDAGLDVVIDAAQDVIATGYSNNAAGDSDFYTVKYAGADGAQVWERRSAGPGGSSDSANEMAVDAAGNVVVTGYIYADDADFYTVKYAAATGAVLWQRRYDGPVAQDDVPNGLAVDGAGNVVVTGYSGSGTSANGYGSDFYTARYAAADGALLWQARAGGVVSQFWAATDVAIDSAGNVLVTGGNPQAGGLYFDYLTIKYAAANGAALWQKQYAGSASLSDSARAVGINPQGDVIVTGVSESQAGHHDLLTLRYAGSTGAQLWESRADALVGREDVAYAVVADAFGNAIATGSSGRNDEGDDYYTAKYASNGQQLWAQRYNGPDDDNDRARAIAADAAGNVFVTGFSNNASNPDYYTAKYAAATGQLLWEKRYSSAGRSEDDAQAIAVDAQGDVIVTGNSSISSSADIYTAKYAGDTGALIWEKRFDGNASADAAVKGIALDAAGNVIITGSAGDPASFRLDYYTAKYAAASGALLWERRYNGPAAQDDSASALAVDGSGNVIVTGSSLAADFRSDYYTAKYAAANGALLWERRFNGSSNGTDTAAAIAVDPAGNAVVTGTSNDQSSAAYYTAKYAALNGALLWERIYHGDGGEDSARGVAVDGNGNAVVTGTSRNLAGNDDIFTVAYSSTNGAVLWNDRLAGNGDADDAPTAIKLDALANVLIAGSVSTSNYSRDFLTFKIAPVPAMVRRQDSR